jgi:hypothetical protein
MAGKRPPKDIPKVKLVSTKSGLVEVPIKDEVKKSSKDKFLKVSANESSEFFKEIGERVQKKELKWSYYSTENNSGVHYYLILNQNQ